MKCSPCKALGAFVRRFDFSYVYALLGEATLGLTFVFYAVLARVVGPEKNGVFSAAVALGGILSVFIQFGLPVLLNREVAEGADEGARNTFLFLVVQTINTVPILLVLPLLVRLLGFVGEGVLVCYLVILAELCRSVKMLWRSVMKGRGWFRMESVAVAIERTLVVLFSGAVLLWTRSLVLAVGTLALSRLVDNLGVGVYLSRKLRTWSPLRREALWATYRKAYPFALHGMLWVLYYQVDMIMLKAMSSAEQVGYYGAAYRVLEIFSALPRVVFYVSFTRFAQCHAQKPSALPERVHEATRMLLLLVLPCLAVAGYLQPFLMRMIYGEAYLPSIILLAVLLPSLGIKMFSTLSEEYLLATGREKRLPPLLLAVAFSNIVANLLLIPRWGAMGAALATCLSEGVYCILGLGTVIRHGLRRCGFQLFLIALLCGGLSLAPSLVFAGFPPGLSLGLLSLCIPFLVLLMRRRTFLGPTRVA